MTVFQYFTYGKLISPYPFFWKWFPKDQQGLQNAVDFSQGKKKLPLCHFDAAYNCFPFKASLQFCDTVMSRFISVLIIPDSLLDSLNISLPQSFVFGSFLFSFHLLPFVISCQPLYILKFPNMSYGEYTDTRICSILRRSGRREATFSLFVDNVIVSIEDPNDFANELLN